MKKAPFKDRCILVKTHSYRQLKNTFCEQMHLCDFDRRNRPANLQFGMSGNEKQENSDQIGVEMKSCWQNTKIHRRIEKFSVEIEKLSVEFKN
ncbi:hypothetical protein [Sunxiuqinia dokdonensis]|uniref:Uncharacterized protein n=1 Tax=Sunxiuqinia dokdonensis TaxID=1409788 RepID=A0A0L8V6P6_9BACT|nr:hypothetical protein [Sunxiuqinia dokdonensis]KOH43877.1 hypothetical protein NC99_33730 [Sunxiuqinia dokdonensis]